MHTVVLRTNNKGDLSMKKSIRLLSLLLMIAMLIGTFAACHKTPDDTEKNTSGLDTNDETADANSEEALLKPADQNFDNYEFNILANLNKFYQTQYYCDEKNVEGDLDMAVFERQALLEEKYGIIINMVESSNPVNDLTTYCSSGTYFCDVAAIPAHTSMQLAIGGYFYNVKELEELNLTASYYDQRIQEEYRVGNYVFLLEGDYSYVDDLRTISVIYNDTLYGDYNYYDTYGTPYNMVRNGEWTYERLFTMIEEKAQNLDSDERMTENDHWGMICSVDCPLAFYYGSGNKIYSNENGTLTLNIADASGYEQTYNLLSYLIENMLESPDAILNNDVSGTGEQQSQNISNIFFGDRALFRVTTTSAILRLLDMESDYGILPIPKYTEEQSEYYSMVSYAEHEPIAFVYNKNRDIGTVASVFEIFAYHSRYGNSNTMYENFYDELAELRICRTPDDREMVQLIFANKCYDIDSVLGLTNISTLIYGMYNNGSYSALSSSLKSVGNSAKYKGQLLMMSLAEKVPSRNE